MRIFTNIISKLMCGAIIISGQTLTADGTEMTLGDKTKSLHYGTASINISTKWNTQKLFLSTSSGKSSPILISQTPNCTDKDKIDIRRETLLMRGDSPIIIYQKLREEFGDNEGNRNYIDNLFD